MANEYIVWNFKERRVEGIFNASADATAALRRISAKSGTNNTKTGKAPLDAGTHLEVLTTTRF